MKESTKDARIKKAIHEIAQQFDLPINDVCKHMTTEELLVVYRKNNCNMSATCRQLGISYTSFRKMYLANTELFNEIKNSCKEITKDFVYSKLLEKVALGDTAAVIFACKSICGMKESSEVTVNSPTLDVESAIKELKDRLACN